MSPTAWRQHGDVMIPSFFGENVWCSVTSVLFSNAVFELEIMVNTLDAHESNNHSQAGCLLFKYYRTLMHLYRIQPQRRSQVM